MKSNDIPVNDQRRAMVNEYIINSDEQSEEIEMTQNTSSGSMSEDYEFNRSCIGDNIEVHEIETSDTSPVVVNGTRKLSTPIVQINNECNGHVTTEISSRIAETTNNEQQQQLNRNGTLSTTDIENITTTTERLNSNKTTSVRKKRKYIKRKKKMSKRSKIDMTTKGKSRLMKEAPKKPLAKCGPVIYIEESKDDITDIQILNKVEEDSEKTQECNGLLTKRKPGKSDSVLKKSAAELALKNYIPSVSDDWICTFCKVHAKSPFVCGVSLGDLFGPYFIRNQKSQSSSTIENNLQIDENNVEVWGHEPCMIWAPGVHLIGSDLVGLEEAVCDSVTIMCYHCKKSGATICCRNRHCKQMVHYPCALRRQWQLDVKNFTSYCNIHRIMDTPS